MTVSREMRNPAAVALGRLGGLKGGKARAAILSREERKRIAQKAAQTRWKPIPFSCPFCHGNDIEYEEYDTDYGLLICNNCGGAGPSGKGQDEATKYWNGIDVKGRNEL
jgi:transcription elongation factor Elf1